MVREWGMSDRIGPMAWGSQGQVFLGEDLMHTRDYSEHTSQIIDDEVELILRAQEERALEVLARHRGGLDAVARALLDEETVDGETVGRLVDTAYGRPVHEHGTKMVPPVFVASQHGPTGSDDQDGPVDQNSSSPAGARAQATDTADTDESDAPTNVGVSGAAQTGSPTDRPTAGTQTPSPWPPPPPPPGHWPQAPATWPGPPAPSRWPHQSPWPPPPPPPSR
jgi:hypothetical protein